MLKGSTVQLIKKTVTETNPFGEPIVDKEETIDVHDVLVGSPSTDDITNAVQLYGKKIEYVLGIPKGDTNDWTDAEVIIFGERFRTVGYPTTGEQSNIPLKWGKNVKVERYG